LTTPSAKPGHLLTSENSAGNSSANSDLLARLKSLDMGIETATMAEKICQRYFREICGECRLFRKDDQTLGDPFASIAKRIAQ
jgi:hypothetical protein